MLADLSFARILFWAFGTVYMARATTDLAGYIVHKANPNDARGFPPITMDRFKWLQDKPFNCNFCMLGWMGLLMLLVPMPFLAIFGVVGIAFLIEAVANRLETIIS